MNLGLFFLILFFGGWLGGKAAALCRLPPVLGMLVAGLGVGNLFPGAIPALMGELGPFLKTMALIVILLRAGLGLKFQDLRSLGLRAIVLGVLPALCEALGLSLTLGLLLSWPWNEAITAGVLLAAVSPAVVVPTMLEIRDKGLGQKNKIPTLILAGASLDNVLVITAFSLVTGGQAADPLGLGAVFAIPLALGASLVMGVTLGLILTWVFNRFYKKIRATEKVLVLIFTALLLIQLGNLTGSPAILGIMTCALILLDRAPASAGETAVKLSKVWVGAEILLFMLIGMAVDISKALPIVGSGVLLVLAGLIFRTIGSAAAVSHLPWKERFFCILANLPKATVQAALGSVAISLGMSHGQDIQALAVIAILITSPLGVIAVRWGQKNLLD